MAINTEANVHHVVMCANFFVKGSDGKYLMLRRSHLKRYAPDFVHPIGGKVDLNEDPLTAGLRELWEEAGIRVKNIRLEAVLNELQPDPDKQENWLIFHFSGEYESGELKTTEEGELLWLTPDQILSQKLFPSVKQVIHHILNENEGCVFATFKYEGSADEGNIEVVSKRVSVR